MKEQQKSRFIKNILVETSVDSFPQKRHRGEPPLKFGLLHQEGFFLRNNNFVFNFDHRYAIIRCDVVENIMISKLITTVVHVNPASSSIGKRLNGCSRYTVPRLYDTIPRSWSTIILYDDAATFEMLNRRVFL